MQPLDYVNVIVKAIHSGMECKKNGLRLGEHKITVGTYNITLTVFEDLIDKVVIGNTYGEVLIRRVSALLDDLSLLTSRIVILRDVSPPFSGKILMVDIVAKRKQNGLVSVQLHQLLKMSWCKREV